MTTIALPSRDLVLPQFHFPPFLRHLRDAKEEAVKRMLSPLGGALLVSPLSAANTVASWWLAGGISAANCVAAYQPKGAASLAASYSNLNNPGTNDASPGTAPTQSSSNGWIFNGTNQYLKTGILITSQSWSVIASYANVTATGSGFVMVGCNQVSGNYLQLTPDFPSNRVSYVLGSTGAGIILVTPKLLTGNMAVAGTKAYRNGVAETGTMAGWSGTGIEIYMGCRNANGSATDFLACEIKSIGFYNIALSAAQVLAVYNAQAAL